MITDLAITGKPAQFGRGVMQDVSDKLLGQFVACLEERLSGPPASVEEPAVPATPMAPAPRPPADDALDLGAAVIPVLLKSYGTQIAAVVGILAFLHWLKGRRSR